jgi:putative phosphoribosyl transferase
MSPSRTFRDREHAGRELAQSLTSYRDQSPLVLGLPRGGVPVAYEVARALDAPLDVLVVKKLGAPMHSELGIGTVAEGGYVFLDEELVRETGTSEGEVSDAIRTKTAEVEERCRRLRRGRPVPDLRDRTVVVVDDGIATGGTVRTALRVLRQRGPRRLVLAVPVASRDILASLRGEADEIVCPSPQDELYAVGGWYDDFHTVEDRDVDALLEQASTPRSR